jgi:hypothetical protein
MAALGEFAVGATALLSPFTGVMGVGGAAFALAEEEEGAASEVGLSLPFKSAGLRSQVESVVSYYDEHGESPPGVVQGALKGEPMGTYGGQGLPVTSPRDLVHSL